MEELLNIKPSSMMRALGIALIIGILIGYYFGFRLGEEHANNLANGVYKLKRQEKCFVPTVNER